MSILYRNGWEPHKADPVIFFRRVLGFELEPWQETMLRAIAAGQRTRMGLVWAAEDDVDEASLACGVVLWRAFCWHRPTILWGGRRSIAAKWMNHLMAIHAASRLDVSLTISENGEDVNAVTSTSFPHWVMRYDGPFLEDSAKAATRLRNGADVLLGDFNWTSRDSVDAALEYADEHGALCTLLVGHG